MACVAPPDNFNQEVSVEICCTTTDLLLNKIADGELPPGDKNADVSTLERPRALIAQAHRIRTSIVYSKTCVPVPGALFQQLRYLIRRLLRSCVHKNQVNAE